MGLASCLWLLRTVLYLDMASSHQPNLVMNIIVYLSVVANGNRLGTSTRCFLQQDSSYGSVIRHRARVDLSVHEYVLGFYKLFVLLSSDLSRPPIRGKLSF